MTKIKRIFKRLPYYFKIWLLMNRNSFLVVLNKKSVLMIFLIGKILRFTFFIAFIYFILKGTGKLAGYNLNQTMIFFLTFSLVDTIAQFIFREVYRFRPLLISGNFDFVLIKPMNALFRSLLGGADVIDLITIPPLIAAIVFVGSTFDPSVAQMILYLALLFNGLLISAAFHVGVISLGILTLEIDHTIMIYRDFVNLGRFPIEIYRQPLRGVLTFLIPVGIMVSFPAKVLMGLISPIGILLSFVIGGTMLFLSMQFWNIALRHYTSASS